MYRNCFRSASHSIRGKGLQQRSGGSSFFSRTEKRGNPLRQFVQRNVANDARYALLNEVASLRTIGLMRRSDENIPRGWDDGMDDDDGG